MGDSTRALSDVERDGGGGILSRPIGLAEGPDGALYVLDADYKKIVTFNEDGSLRSLFVTGRGEGPGELKDPRFLTIDDRGHLWVLDEGQARISEFHPDGTFLSSFQVALPGPTYIVALQDRLYVSRRHLRRAGEPLITIFSRTGEELDSILPASPQDVELAISGATAVLGPGPNDVLLVGNVTAGIWTELGSGWEVRHEAPDHERLAPLTMTSRQGFTRSVVPLNTQGIGRLAGGETVVFYARSDPDSLASGRNFRRYFVDVFDREGALVGVHAVSEDLLPGRLLASRKSGDFFLTDHAFIPKVIRLHVEYASPTGG